MTLTTFRSVLAGGGDRGSRGHDEDERPRTHTVASGENLSAIARQHGTTVEELARINNIANPNLIHAGQVLQLPGGAGGHRTYTVKAGDTLSKIGEHLGVDWRKLAADNGLPIPTGSRSGWVLRF
jgi:LysM repeat protein